MVTTTSSSLYDIEGMRVKREEREAKQAAFEVWR